MVKSITYYGPSKQTDSGEELYKIDAYPCVPGTFFEVDRERGIHVDSIPGKPTQGLLNRVSGLLTLPQEEREDSLSRIRRRLEILDKIRKRNGRPYRYSRGELLDYGVLLWPISSTEWREVRGVPSLPPIQREFGSWRDFSRAVEERVREVGEDYIPDFDLEGKVERTVKYETSRASPLLRRGNGQGKIVERQLPSEGYRRGSITSYFDDIRLVGDVVSDEEQMELARRMKQGDDEARDKLIECNLRFVVSLAKEYQNSGVDFDDLIQAGNLGLLIAAEKFDVTRGIKFYSYAVWQARQQMLSAIKDHGRNVRFPGNIHSDYNMVDRVVQELEQSSVDPFLHLDYIAEQTDLSEDVVMNILSSRIRERSFDGPIRHGDNRGLYEVFHDRNQANPDQLAVENSTKETIKKVLYGLTPRERKVVKLYFGIDEESWKLDQKPSGGGRGGGFSLDEIAEMFGLTRERVRQIKEQALGRLKVYHRLRLLEQLID